MGSGSLECLIRLGCLVQRLTVYTVATVNSHLPIALDNQPANLCIGIVIIVSQLIKLKTERYPNQYYWNSDYCFSTKNSNQIEN